MMPPQLEAELLARLEELERTEVERLKQASRVGWTSLALAAGLLVVLLASGLIALSRVKREVAAMEAQRAQLQRDTAGLHANKAQLEREVAQKQLALATSFEVLGQINEADRRSAVEAVVAKNPRAAELLPRVYIQIVDSTDRLFAAGMGRKLQAAGYMVPGVEYRGDSKPFSKTEVRFYKIADEEGAKRVLSVLEAAGLNGKTVYLEREENNPRVKANHFEVWFPSPAVRARPVIQR